jgi:hypothetical protein
MARIPQGYLESGRMLSRDEISEYDPAVSKDLRVEEDGFGSRHRDGGSSYVREMSQ